MKRTTSFSFALFSLFLLTWVFFQTHIRIPADGAWLMLAAEKFLNHIPMGEGYWDNNPPMSYMIYSPVIWISDLLNADKVLSYTLYTGGLLFLSFWSLNSFLNYYKSDTKNILLIGYLISITFIPLAEFGQKDHLIAMMLPVFILAQYALTMSHSSSKFKIHTALILSTPFLLIKPHFGLLPVLMLAHRLYKKRSLSILKDPDFIYLSIGTLLYGSVTLIFFPEYIKEILPLAVDLYASIVSERIVLIGGGFGLFSLCLLVFMWAQDSHTKEKEIGFLFAFMALLSLIPVVIQAKGFSVHLLPIFSFLLPATLLCLWSFITRPLQKHHTIFSMGFAFILILALYGLTFTSERTKTLNVETYTHTPFAAFIHENAQGSSLFIESWSTNLIVSTLLHQNIQMASRFSSTWFVPSLLLLSKTEPEKATRYKDLLEDHLHQDFKSYRPQTILLFNDSYQDINLLNLYHGDPLQDYITTHYRQEESVSFSLNEERFNDEGHVIYDVYLRKKGL